MTETRADLPRDDGEDKKDNNLTISTKLSTDRLICKTPQESPDESLRSGKEDGDETEGDRAVLHLGFAQIVFGLLMTVFGVLVIVHDASLSQIGGGLWGGCIAVCAGTTGILAAARTWCPLKTGAQKLAQTVCLALSLVSLAIAQLVMVLAATGLIRDVEKTQIIEINSELNQDDGIVEVLPSNYPAILSNVGLLVISAIECVCAAVASYRGARAICPCFRRGDDHPQYAREALVSSWLGKHTPPPHIYVVHAPGSLGKHGKMSGGLPPFFAIPQHHMGPTVYPLIPAPLGAVPSPMIPTPPRDLQREYRRYLRDQQRVVPTSTNTSRSRSRSKSKERTVTAEDVAKTYTGLDRTIAEEFIQMCDSRNGSSLCSESVCRCGSGCTTCTTSSSDVTSTDDFLIDKI